MPYFNMVEWDSLIFCKQTSFQMAAIGTLRWYEWDLLVFCKQTPF